MYMTFEREETGIDRKFITFCIAIIFAGFVGLAVTVAKQGEIIRTQKVQIEKLRETNSELNLDNKELGKMNDQLYDQVYGFKKLPDGKYGVDND